jgi:hypothetical protein
LRFGTNKTAHENNRGAATAHSGHLSGNTSLSEDLTVILLRGNGSPRTFRLSLPALQRSLTALGFLFAFSVMAAIFLLLLNIFRPTRTERVVTVAPAPVAEPREAAPPRPAFWNKLTGGTGSENEAEMRKEIEGLRDDVAKLSAQADDRKNLQAGATQGLIQFFGPRNVEEGISPISVKNIRVSESAPGAATKEIFVDFELHNIDPEQRQARGYIVVLAKTPALLSTYPEGAMAPSQNILLDYTKGETFAVSRFREARANFVAAPLEGKRPRFQVLLFSTDGKVIANMHVEDTR